jgi:hypothetical protein
VDVVFVPLAMNQTRFYLGIADAFRERGLRSAFLCFHEGSLDVVRSAGYPGRSGFAGDPVGPEQPDRLMEEAEAYGIQRPGSALSHEMASYELTDPRALLAKLVRYLRSSEQSLRAFMGSGARPVVVQELGGFLSVQSVFYAARRLGLDNLFFEPSFFRGRLFITANTLSAPRVHPHGRVAGAGVQAYLEETKEKARIVIPTKDRAHYRSPARKLLSARNLRRLFEKTVDKYVLGKREEFEHIGGHVRRHVAMARNAALLRTRYVGLPEEPFIYYPLHVSGDVALTLRSPEYLDQIALIEYLARTAPPTHLVAIKEHPALRGGIDRRRTVAMLRRFENVRLLDPGLNNYAVLRRADAVVTVNSKSGAEAMLLGRPVVVLGDAFYRDSGLVESVTALSELPGALDRALSAAPTDPARVASYFQAVWDETYPGELYELSPENCDVVATSIERAMRACAEPAAARGA